MQAADAILVAIKESGQSQISLHPRLLGRSDQPALFQDFTFHEVCEAEQFLIRCGLLSTTLNRPESNC